MTEKTFDWGKFDKKLNIDALKEDVEKAKENSSDFPEIPEGDYEVVVEALTLGQSKKGDPMLKITFNILDGEFKGHKIFYNGVMQPNNSSAFGFQVHKNNELLRGLWDATEEEVSFNGFKDYSSLIEEIADEIVDEWEYLLRKGRTSKGYETLEIVEIFDAK